MARSVSIGEFVWGEEVFLMMVGDLLEVCGGLLLDGPGRGSDKLD